MYTHVRCEKTDILSKTVTVETRGPSRRLRARAWSIDERIRSSTGCPEATTASEFSWKKNQFSEKIIYLNKSGLVIRIRAPIISSWGPD